MSAQHTPGPWTILPGGADDLSWVIATASQQTTIAFLAHRSDTEIELANARLIAAAPDMLAKLIEVAGECAECGGGGVIQYADDKPPCPDCADIRAVIAKAEQP